MGEEYEPMGDELYTPVEEDLDDNFHEDDPKNYADNKGKGRLRDNVAKAMREHADRGLLIKALIFVRSLVIESARLIRAFVTTVVFGDDRPFNWDRGLQNSLEVDKLKAGKKSSERNQNRMIESAERNHNQQGERSEGNRVTSSREAAVSSSENTAEKNDNKFVDKEKLAKINIACKNNTRKKALFDVPNVGFGRSGIGGNLPEIRVYGTDINNPKKYYYIRTELLAKGDDEKFINTLAKALSQQEFVKNNADNKNAVNTNNVIDSRFVFNAMMLTAAIKYNAEPDRYFNNPQILNYDYNGKKVDVSIDKNSVAVSIEGSTKMVNIPVECLKSVAECNPYERNFDAVLRVADANIENKKAFEEVLNNHPENLEPVQEQIQEFIQEQTQTTPVQTASQEAPTVPSANQVEVVEEIQYLGGEQTENSMNEEESGIYEKNPEELDNYFAEVEAAQNEISDYDRPEGLAEAEREIFSPDEGEPLPYTADNINEFDVSDSEISSQKDDEPEL